MATRRGGRVFVEAMTAGVAASEDDVAPGAVDWIRKYSGSCASKAKRAR